MAIFIEPHLFVPRFHVSQASFITLHAYSQSFPNGSKPKREPSSVGDRPRLSCVPLANFEGMVPPSSLYDKELDAAVSMELYLIGPSEKVCLNRSTEGIRMQNVLETECWQERVAGVERLMSRLLPDEERFVEHDILQRKEPPETAADDLPGELGEVLEQSLGKAQDQKNLRYIVLLRTTITSDLFPKR